jgi:sec-independent protein translocase protein TatA
LQEGNARRWMAQRPSDVERGELGPRGLGHSKRNLGQPAQLRVMADHDFPTAADHGVQFNAVRFLRDRELERREGVFGCVCARAAVGKDEHGVRPIILPKACAFDHRSCMVSRMRLGFGELFVIGFVLLVVFSASRMGRLGNALGKFVYSFKRAAGGKDTIDVTASKLPRGEEDAEFEDPPSKGRS